MLFLQICVAIYLINLMYNSHHLQSERRPHALAYVETAMRLGSVINTCETADELSRCLGGSKAAEGKAKMKSIKPELGPGLPGSNTNV